MRICVFGAGAIGGHIAAKLASAGHDVSAVARGANLAALQAGGIALREGERTIAGPVRASGRAAELGAQDVVFVTTKATALASLEDAVPSLSHRDTMFGSCRTAFPGGTRRTSTIYPARASAAAGSLAARPAGARAQRCARARDRRGGVFVQHPRGARRVTNFSAGRNMLVVGEPDDRPFGARRGLARAARRRRPAFAAGARYPRGRVGQAADRISPRRLCGPSASRSAHCSTTRVFVRCASACSPKAARSHSARRAARGRAAPPGQRRADLRCRAPSPRCCRITSLAGRWRWRRSSPCAFARSAGVEAPALECWRRSPRAGVRKGYIPRHERGGGGGGGGWGGGGGGEGEGGGGDGGSQRPARLVDLRSDTVTRPSAGMRRAMMAAPLGDDVFGDDPTVNRLQARAAADARLRARRCCSPPARNPTSPR